MSGRHRSPHAKIVEWSKEDNCYIGRCPTLFGGGVHGSDELKVYRHLCQVVAEWEQFNRRQASARRAPRRGRAESG